MDTDYDNYALVYSCSPDDMAFLYFLSRETTLPDYMSDDMLANAKSRLPNYDFTQLIKDV